jgi:release factor glutamine methyltransferase
MPEAAVTGAPVTLRAALQQATADLQATGIDAPGNDARRLLAGALGLSDVQILSQPDLRLTPEQAERLARVIARRSAREPVSRILGSRDFYGRSFAISPATLDPRPESETLIEATLQLVRLEGWQSEPIRILDVGTGSGCLLLTLLCELPRATGVGTDISEKALEIARRNARRLGVENRCEWLSADALEGIDGRFQVLVSNPPYIPTAEIAQLEPEVRDHDPITALDGGDDGLRFFHRFASRIPDVIPNGWIVLEVGHDQADAVIDLLAFGIPGIERANIRAFFDVAGKRRAVAARSLR